MQKSRKNNERFSKLPPLFDLVPMRRFIIATILVIILWGGLYVITKRMWQNEADHPVATKIETLEENLDLRIRFELYGKTPRVILLLSPTCESCLEAADFIQKEILDKNKNSEIYVFIVWYPALPEESRDKWSDQILTDRRAIHWWDENGLIREFFEKELPSQTEDKTAGDNNTIDRYYIYDVDAEWIAGQPPTNLLTSGRGILQHQEEIIKTLEPYVGKAI